jgi:hypothetical protein
MKAITNSVLAAAVLLALPFASEACTIAAWNGNTGAAAGAFAGGPNSTPGVYRLYGLCGLETNPGEFVTDNTPNAETNFQMQVYFKAPASGSAKFFSATSANSNAGTEAFGITYNGGALSFSGVTGAANITGLQANRVYRLRASYTAGGAFNVVVTGFGNFSGSSSGTAGATTITSASLGMLSGTAARLEVDEYHSTRSVSTAISGRCVGDANGSGNVSAADRSAITAELGGTLAVGFPDCNMDGNVTAGDRSCVTGLLSLPAGEGCN